MIDLCIVSFSFYMISLIRQTKDVSYYSVYPVIAICALNIILIVLGVYNGNFFTVTDHHLVYGSWADSVTIMPVAAVIVLLIVLLMNIKALGKRNALALGSFVGFPLIAAIIVFFFPNHQMAYIASALSCGIIFTFIRREQINEAQIREQIMDRLSSLNTLTGLQNRRGFDEAIAKAGEHERLGIAFCDLNALKYTNDSFGHAAGDAYIKRFANILRQVFSDIGPICRISGDEFVVLLYDISENELEDLREKMYEAIRKNDRIASVGYAYGSSSAALELIRRAENEMYDDKNRFYSETGLDRRRGIQS